MKLSNILLLCSLFTASAIAANYTRQEDVIVKNTMSVGSNAAPNSKAVLDVSSTTKGFLPPRMTTVQKNAITSPTEGLVAYDSNLHAPFWYNGTSWLQGATLSGSETLQNKTLDNTNTITLKDTLFTLQDDGDTTKQMKFQLSGITTGTTRTFTMPDTSDTIVTLSAAQAIASKTLDNTNTITLKDTLFTLQDDGDTSKQAKFQLSGLTTATTRTYTLPDASSTLVDIATTQTLAGKTLTAPAVNNPNLNGGTASNTSRILLPSDTTTNLDALTDTAGLIAYDTTQSKPVYNNGSGWTAVGTGSGSSSGINILASKNRDAELGATTNWTASAGTFTVTSTAANVGNGGYSFSWDASATSQNVSSDAVAIPSGLYGANCLMEFYYKGFDSNITAQVYDGSSVIASTSLVASSGFAKVQLNFICPSTGSLQMRLLSSADAAIGYWDEVHLGSATNISQVSQAVHVGSAYYAVTASCNWAVTNTALTDFATTSACPSPTVLENPGPGIIQTTDADLPQFTVNNLPPGLYRVHIVVWGGPTSGVENTFAISDGTTTCQGNGAEGSGTPYGSAPLTCYFTYTTTANKTFKVKGSATSGAQNIRNSAGNSTLQFYIDKFPASNDQSVTPQVAANSWSGFHDSDCSWSYASNGSVADPTGDASCTFTEKTNRNYGTVASATSGGNNIPGIVWTPAKTGMFFVCANATASLSSGAGRLFLTDGTTVIANGGNGVATNPTTIPLCGIYNVATTTSKTIKIQGGNTSAVTMTLGGASSAPAVHSVEWTIFPIDQALPGPVVLTTNTRSVTTTDTATCADDILTLSGASFTETLPAPTGCPGKRFVIMHSGTSWSQVYALATADSSAFKTSGGDVASAAYKLISLGESIELQAVGSNYYVRNHLTNMPRASCTLTYACTTNGTHAAYCWRRGDEYCVDALSTYTGASNATTCTATLPSGPVISTAKLSGGTATSNQSGTLVGTGMWQDAGSAFKVIQFQYASTTSVQANENPGLLTGSSFANGDSVKWLFCVPLVDAQP